MAHETTQKSLEATPKPITLPGAPTIPGLTARTSQGYADFFHINRVAQAANDANGIEHYATVEETADGYRKMENFDMLRDMAFVEVGSEVVAYARTEWWDTEDKGRAYFLLTKIHPAWRAKGLRRPLLRWAIAHQQGRAKTHALPAGKPHHLMTGVLDTETEYIAALEAEGFTPDEHFATLVRPHLDNIEEPVLPPGIEVRPVEESHLPQIWAADREAFRDHVGYEEQSDEQYEKQHVQVPYYDPSLWRVAWDGDEVVGMVRSFINPQENAYFNRKRGWTEDISVRRAWRRKGVARALLLMSLQAIKERGMEEAALGVHTENPNGAYKLYESVGFEHDKTWIHYTKPFDTDQ